MTHLLTVAMVNSRVTPLISGMFYLDKSRKKLILTWFFSRNEADDLQVSFITSYLPFWWVIFESHHKFWGFKLWWNVQEFNYLNKILKWYNEGLHDTLWAITAGGVVLHIHLNFSKTGQGWKFGLTPLPNFQPFRMSLTETKWHLHHDNLLSWQIMLM